MKGLRVGKFFGVELFIHKSWLILFGLLLFSFFQSFNQLLGVPLFLKYIFTFISVILIMVTLLTHEIAHCLIGRRFGFGMTKMTLFVLGAVASVENAEDSDSFYKMGPGREFKMAIVGPITSFLLSVVFFCLLFFMLSRWFPIVIRDALVAWRVYTSILLMFNLTFVVNMIVGVFNLIPAFPMDGGRILRSAIWRKKGLLRGTTIACTIGRLMGMIGFPLMGLFLFGSLFSMLWLGLIGFFILMPSCAQELQRVKEILEKGELRG